MTILTGRDARPPILAAEPPKSPWGNGDDDQGGGPRNPWALPPGGRRTGAKPTALDEFLRKARGGGGGNGGGGGFGGLPGTPNARALWLEGLGGSRCFPARGARRRLPPVRDDAVARL